MQRPARIALGLVPVAVLAAITAGIAGDHSSHSSRHNDHASSQSRVERGFALAPVKLNLHHKNHDLVGLGSYIVNAQGGCNDCHTCPPYTPDHDPFNGGDGVPNAANYLAGGTAFGPFISRNITPDATGRPAGLTRQEFIELLQTGHDPDFPGRLLQVMPWPIYGHMVTSDLSAVYEYLSAIPHAEHSPDCTEPPAR